MSTAYRSFPARFPGFCTDCEQPIEEGQLIYRTMSGLIVHQSCPESLTLRKTGVCDKCFMEKSNNGKCGCE